MRRVPTVAAVLAAAGGAAALVRRRLAARERVSLHYEDGSMLTLDARAPQAQRLLAVAREALSSPR
jgi:hypothetical protein